MTQPTALVQYKGTEICLDFSCPCGNGGHFDGYFAYALECSHCGQVYEMPTTLALTPVEETIYDPITVGGGNA